MFKSNELSKVETLLSINNNDEYNQILNYFLSENSSKNDNLKKCDKIFEIAKELDVLSLTEMSTDLYKKLNERLDKHNKDNTLDFKL